MIGYFIKNIRWPIISTIVLAAAAFITTVALTNLLTVESFGIYRYAMTIIPLLAIFSLPDMGQSVTRAVAKGYALSFGKIIRSKICYGIIGGAISLCLSLFYFYQGNVLLGNLFLIASVGIPFFDVFFIYQAYLFGKESFKKASLYLMLSRVFSAACIILTAFVTASPVYILLAYFVSQIAPQVVLYKKIVPREVSGEDTTLDAVSFGKSLTVVGGFSVFIASLDKLFVWHWFGAEALAIYVVALLITQEMVRLLESLALVALPFLSASKDDSRIEMLLKTLPALFGLLVLAALSIIAVIPYVFKFFFEPYVEHVLLAQLSTALLLVAPLNAILIRYLVSKKALRTLLGVYTVKLSVFVLSLLILVSTYALPGVLAALLLAEISTFALLYRHASANKSQQENVQITAERRFSQKILLHKIRKNLPFLEPIFLRWRLFTTPEFCQNYPSPTASYSDGSWIERKTTGGQQAIDAYLRDTTYEGRLLHVGIGSSELASSLGDRNVQIDGITIVLEEKAHGEALNLFQYTISLVNKNNPNELRTLRGEYDRIVDNNLSSYSCCIAHFREMMAIYTSLLAPDGSILSNKSTLTYFDTGFPLLPKLFHKVLAENGLELHEPEPDVLELKRINFK